MGWGGAAGEFFAGFGPGVDPVALAASEGVAGGGEDVADVGDGEGVELLALGVAGVVPGAVLEDVEGVAVGDDLPLAGADGVDLLAVLVVDVVPGTGGLDVTDALGLQGGERQQQGDECEEDAFHI